MITVTDNGVGRKKAQELGNNVKHKSMAMEITGERLAILSRKFKKQFHIHSIDKKDNTGNDIGFEVVINIPVKSIL